MIGTKNVARDMVHTLKEAGIPADYYPISRLDEAKTMEVADSVLASMFKFITDKYNSLDFREIEQSAGDYMKFKYKKMLDSNLKTLDVIYTSSGEDSAKKYLDIVEDLRNIENWLIRRRSDISYLYKKRKGSIQMIYTSIVASMIYTIAALISNTIRYVTVDKNADLEILFDEIPNAFKNIHIRNTKSIASSISEFDNFINNTIEGEKKTLVSEAGIGDIFSAGYGMMKNVGKGFLDGMKPDSADIRATNQYNRTYKAARNLASNKFVKGAAYVAIGAGLAFAIWKSGVIIMGIIRSIILTIYYSRINTKQALEININLLRANIEALESRGEKPKVIANQRKWLERLEKFALKFANDTDRGEILAQRDIDRQNKQLKVSEPEYYTEDDYGNELMI